MAEVPQIAQGLHGLEGEGAWHAIGVEQRLSVFQCSRMDQTEGTAQAMAADKQFFVESFFQNRLAQFLRIDPSGHFVRIAKA
ncbi:hypothetical protein D3C76_678230 [compost metagenome]